MKPEPIQLAEDTFEIPCYVCGEPLICQVGDEMNIRVVEDGSAHPICTECFKASQ